MTNEKVAGAKAKEIKAALSPLIQLAKIMGWKVKVVYPKRKKK